MKKLMNLMVLSCKKASLLIEKSHCQSLSLLDKLQLNIHLRICDKCPEYEKQSLFIENQLKVQRQNFPNVSNLKLSESSKSLINKKIEDKLKNI